MPRGSAIRDLDKYFGMKWRVDDKCRKPYNHRKLIWEAILRVIMNLNLPLGHDSGKNPALAR